MSHQSASAEQLPEEHRFEPSALAPAPPLGAPTLSEDDALHVERLATAMMDRARDSQVELPAFPALASRVLNIMDQKNPDLVQLVDVIRNDAMVSAQVLRMANSAFYSRGLEVTSVKAAAVRLGVRAVANVAVAAATRALLDAQERELHDCFREQWKQLGDYSMSAAVSARWLSGWLSKGEPEAAFLGGLIHDLGKMVGLRFAGQMVQDGDLPADLGPVLLTELLEETHVSLGFDLGVAWGLPGHVVYVIEHHHQAKPEAVPVNDVLHVVRIASSLYEARVNPLLRASLRDELYASADAFGLADEPLAALAEELKRLANNAPFSGASRGHR
jgi:HD-like signal output (HDOD) protein